MIESSNQALYSKIAELLVSARNSVVRSVNQTMVITYFEIGRMIVEDEQKGELRAEYGKAVLKQLSERLSADFGKGFSVDNLQNMRLFFTEYSKYEKLSRNFILSWSHYLKLMRIDNIEERQFYEIESANNNWSLRELNRQCDSALYERLCLSKDKEAIKQLSVQGQLVEKPSDLIKDPYILEFVGLPILSNYSESDLEKQLIDQLEYFLLELGKGFTFVGRQQRFTFDEEQFRVDLVFYNRLLRCFVLIDIKMGKLKHQDLGQMQMYINYYDRFVKTDDENPSIGIILCKDKKDSMVEITLPKGNDQIFASKYQTVFPTKEQLKQLIETQ